MDHRRTAAAGAANPSLVFVVLAVVVLSMLVVARLGSDEDPCAPGTSVAAPVGTRPSDAPTAAMSAADDEGVATSRASSREQPIAVTGHGRVVDPDGNGLPGVAVGRESASAATAALATSDREGAFALRDVPEGARLVACDERWVTIAAAAVHRTMPAVLVVAPCLAVAGTVIDAEGRPVAGAMLSIAIPAEAGGGDAPGCGVQWLAFSDGVGAFAFAAAPGVAMARLCTQHPGHRTDERALAVANPRGIVVTLVAEPAPPPVSGTVFGPEGAPVANASVRMGESVVATAPDGTFVLLLPSHLFAGAPVFVVANGCTPVALPDPRPADGREAAPLVVQLQPAVAITGRIVDAAGAPLPQWTVVLGDPTSLRVGRDEGANVEGWLGSTRVVTDAYGAFTIAGVFARPYSIEAWDERGERGLRASASPTAGPVTLVARERDAATLCGLVVDCDGQPVAGVVVGERRPGCLAAGALAMRFDHRVTTDVDGRFELPLRGAALHLVVDGVAIVPGCIALPETASDAPLRLEVARRRDVRIAAADAPSGIALLPLSGAGNLLPACEPSPGTFGLPATTRALVVHHHGVATGTLPMPKDGEALVLRMQPALR